MREACWATSYDIQTNIPSSEAHFALFAFPLQTKNDKFLDPRITVITSLNAHPAFTCWLGFSESSIPRQKTFSCKNVKTLTRDLRKQLTSNVGASMESTWRRTSWMIESKRKASSSILRKFPNSDFDDVLVIVMRATCNAYKYVPRTTNPRPSSK